ncbi:LysR family transcriptional regulator [Methylobacterium terricola]|uniref:LysR family transcriptional regulator n=1 Tax=Methylobacterium terricola TaxID=2583531 RepID=A0A5C4LL92_9HYPH|nr:LysR substrate-binding domain-containing protein [Methylobacterium terricola]TNC14445.1 LysR family transcriptional regulator [Methylobacterium terricola]
MAKIVALHYFAVVTRCSSLRDAATQLDIHPNVLARHISQLEYYMDAPLLERGPLGIRLTAAGELLAAKLDRTINELDHVARLIDDLKGLRGGLVGVHAAEGVASAVLVPVLAAFSARYPQVRARLRTGTAKDAVRAIEDASCDLALTFFAPASDAIAVVRRVRLPQFIIAPPGHPVTQAGGAVCTLLGSYRWVLPGPEFGVRTFIDRAAAEAGCRIVPTFEAASLALQRALIREAGALAVLPRAAFADEIAAGTMVAVPFPEAMPVETSLDLCVPADRQPSFAAERLRRDLETALMQLRP